MGNGRVSLSSIRANWCQSAINDAKLSNPDFENSFFFCVFVFVFISSWHVPQLAGGGETNNINLIRQGSYGARLYLRRLYNEYDVCQRGHRKDDMSWRISRYFVCHVILCSPWLFTTKHYMRDVYTYACAISDFHDNHTLYTHGWLMIMAISSQSWWWWWRKNME
jgi:hypothetical protein